MPLSTNVTRPFSGSRLLLKFQRLHISSGVSSFTRGFAFHQGSRLPPGFSLSSRGSVFHRGVAISPRSFVFRTFSSSGFDFRSLHEVVSPNDYTKYYIPKPGEVLDFLNRHYQFPRKTNNDKVLKIKCPKCRPKKSNFFSIEINVNDGTYRCNECMTKGTWKDYMQLITKTSTFQVINSTQMGIGCPSYLSSPEEIEQYSNELQNYPKVIEKFENNHGITLTTLLAYKVGIATYCNIKSNSSIEISRQDAKELCITFPRMAPCFDDQDQDNILRYKVARIKAYSVEDYEFITFDPPSVHSGLFGYHLVPLECETIILTGNEYDAMTVYQETQIPATCLPNNGYQLPIEILPLLERFSKIYIWLNDDVQGQDAAEKFAQKLGIDRCLIVNTRCNNFDGPINASQALTMGKNLNEILSLAKPLQHEQILNFDNLKEAVYREVINPGQVRGISSKDLPALTQILKGHRPGELTIFTGPTGSGKTTILSQLSLDYCKSGVSTLWGSFEIPNIRLAKKMLTQFAGEDLSKNPGEFMNWAQKFQQLPMYFLKFFGSTEVSTVIDAMNHAIYAFDVQHIIIDNLQFMISEQGKFTDRWELQDRTISAFRRFATDKNVHITMVVHPKKDSRELLDMSSIFGSAKISQEADNVIILQKIESEDGDERYLHIKKNRFDGTLGAIPIEFIPNSLKIRHLRKKKFQEVNHLFADKQIFEKYSSNTKNWRSCKPFTRTIPVS